MACPPKGRREQAKGECSCSPSTSRSHEGTYFVHTKLKSLRESLLAQEKREEEEQAQVRAEQTRLAELEADLAKKKAEAVALRSKLGKKPTKK